ncbi:MAG TPA: DUF4915 domain-containing protein, partial [Candidatus Limnocylindria bacterium]|nr:DUF4915 domain-containing protein [Candidatus Limnocylindria bacterium]
WEGAAAVDPRLLRQRARGAFWDVLAEAGVTLLVTREYEHLLLALHVGRRGPAVTYLPLPHPSGIAVDRRRGLVHVASTRNPNQLVTLAPVHAVREVGRAAARAVDGRPLVPVRATFLPGGLYLHDLALIRGRLHANAVAQNAIVRFDERGGWRRVWWPRVLQRLGRRAFARNYLQLNSIAAGATLRASFFTASTDTPSARRPGHQNFPVDRRGVVFSGATGEVVARGLTRPHSARLHRGRLWVDDSGYGRVGVVATGAFEPVATLPGWTRGLAFAGDVAFVGTSRVLPRFHQYAPGLEPRRCECAVHALDTHTGRLLGSLVWPFGNQIFAIEAVPPALATALPLAARPPRDDARALFYGFMTRVREETP